MRKKLLSYTIAAAIIIMVSLTHQLLGHHNASTAYASASAYVDASNLPAKTKTLMESVSYQPENLLKVTAQDVRAVLNEPELIRKDLPTVIWQYRADACVLDIYFQTQQDNDDAAHVVHFEVRTRGKDSPASYDLQRGCIKSLLDKHGGVHMVDVSKFYKSAEK
jgi:hypothetical protein